MPYSENYIYCDAGTQNVRDRVTGSEDKWVGRGQIMNGLVGHAKELDACI